METIDFSMMSRCGPPDLWSPVMALATLVILVLSRTRRGRGAGSWWFTFGALALASLGAGVAAHEHQLIWRAMARVGSGSVGAISAGLAETLSPLFVAVCGAALLASVGALSAARVASARTLVTARRTASLGGLAAALVVVAMTCILATGFVVRTRLGARATESPATAVASTIDTLTWLALISGALAMLSSISGMVFTRSQAPDEAGRPRRAWLVPVLVLLGTVVLGIIVHRDLEFFGQAARTGAFPD